MPLDPTQLAILKSTRNRERQRGVSLYLLTGSGIASDDAYSVQNYTRQLLRTFSGAIGWIPTELRRGTEGGFIQTSELTIAIDRVEKPFLERKDTYLEVDGIRLRITRLVDVPETEEVVINGERFEP